MSKTTFTATFGGQTFTRKSDRAYTHAVSCKRNFEAALAYAQTRDPQDAKNHAYFCRLVETNGWYSWEKPESIESKKKAAAMTREEYCQQQINRRVDDVIDAQGRGEYTHFLRPTFHSSLALAQKEAAKDRAAGRLEVTIAEVSSI